MGYNGPVHAPPGFTGLHPHGILASRNKTQAPAQARESLGAEPPLQSPAPDLAGTAPRSNWPRPGAAYLLPDRAHAPATWTRSDCTQPACGPDPTNDSTISPKPHVELGMAVSKRLICPNNNLIASIWRFNISCELTVDVLVRLCKPKRRVSASLTPEIS